MKSGVILLALVVTLFALEVNLPSTTAQDLPTATVKPAPSKKGAPKGEKKPPGPDKKGRSVKGGPKTTPPPGAPSKGRAFESESEGKPVPDVSPPETVTPPKPGGDPVPLPEPITPVPLPEPIKPVPSPEPIQPVPLPEPIKPVPLPGPVKPVPLPEPIRSSTPSPKVNNPKGADDDEATEAPPKLDMNATEPVKCDPRSYVQRGYCQKYFTCNRKLRQEIKRGCSDGLFWNPNYNSIHGGVCDYLRNIENETLYEYKKDPTCILDVAYFRAQGECSSKYFYNHPTRTEGAEVEEACPKGLVWSKQKESCELCHMVKKSDGNPCCSVGMEDDY